MIAHIIHRLDVGGLENGLVNLINRLPPERYRHAIICLTGYSPTFRRRILRDLPIHALDKREGQDPGLYVRLWRLLRQLRPDLVHTRNLATLEAQLPAFLAGVPHRVHGEHGHDVHDLDNRRRRYRWLRAAFRPLIQRYIPLSRELERYLVDDVGVPRRKLVTICNGVDMARFHPASGPGDRANLLPTGFVGADSFVIGTVGRLEPVKDQLTLARAFVELVARLPEHRSRLRLVVVGDGSLRELVAAQLAEAGLAEQVWFAGNRSDVPECLRAMDLFVLPSLGEGISNTILEAMATGLPVVATAVGGNGELVVDGETGYLVPRSDPLAMAAAIERYLADPGLRDAQGRAARRRVEREFSLDGMVERYRTLYDGLLGAD